MKISVREMKISDVESVVNYFLRATPDFLRGMGADPDKIPDKVVWVQLLKDELKKAKENKEFYYIIWLMDDQPIGHSNINKIQFGDSAFMHLHLWKNNKRQRGTGTQFLHITIPYYFKNFNLKKLYFEPYALNPAPNKILPKVGFDFVKTYETTPGWINFHQKVNRWIMISEKIDSNDLN